jgi:two-component sensor histidine kinase
LDRLAREIAAHPLRAGKVSRHFTVSAPELAVEIDQALPLALIINELVELANGEHERPQLRLESTRGMVVVEATGLNLRAQDRLHCPIISALAAQLDGEALIPPEKPTSVTVRVPRRALKNSENPEAPKPPVDDPQLEEDRIP